MNREELKRRINNGEVFNVDKLIDKIYDHHEEQLKIQENKCLELKDLYNKLDEKHDLLKIKNIELVEMKEKTCEGCNYWEEARPFSTTQCMNKANNETVYSPSWDFNCKYWVKKDV